MEGTINLTGSRGHLLDLDLALGNPPPEEEGGAGTGADMANMRRAGAGAPPGLRLAVAAAVGEVGGEIDVHGAPGLAGAVDTLNTPSPMSSEESGGSLAALEGPIAASPPKRPIPSPTPSSTGLSKIQKTDIYMEQDPSLTTPSPTTPTHTTGGLHGHGRGRGVSAIVRNAAAAVADVVRRTATAVRGANDMEYDGPQVLVAPSPENPSPPPGGFWDLAVVPVHGRQEAETCRDLDLGEPRIRGYEKSPPEDLVTRLRAILGGSGGTAEGEATPPPEFRPEEEVSAEEGAGDDEILHGESLEEDTNAAWAHYITREEVYGSLQNFYEGVMTSNTQLQGQVDGCKEALQEQDGRIASLEGLRESDRLGQISKDLHALQGHVCGLIAKSHQEQTERNNALEGELGQQKKIFIEVEQRLAALQHRVYDVEVRLEMAVTTQTSSSSSAGSGSVPFKVAEVMGMHGARLSSVEDQILPDFAVRLAEVTHAEQELRKRVKALEAGHHMERAKLAEMQTTLHEAMKEHEKRQQGFFGQVQGQLKNFEAYMVAQVSKMEQEWAAKAAQLRRELPARLSTSAPSPPTNLGISSQMEQMRKEWQTGFEELAKHMAKLEVSAKRGAQESSTKDPMVSTAVVSEVRTSAPSLSGSGSNPTLSVAAPLVLGTSISPSVIPKIDRSKRRSGGGLGTLGLLSSQVRSAEATVDIGVAINQVQARTVPVAASHPMLNVVPASLAGHLLGAEPRRFSGERADWPEWRWQWLQYHELVQEAVPSLTSRQSLSLLRHYLDAATADQLDAELFRDPQVEYADFWVKVDLEFGGDSGESNRAQWTSLRLRHDGSLKLKDWRSFSQRFLKLMRMVPDASEEEASRLMWNVLPVEWRRRIATEAEKKAGDKVLVVEGLASTLSETEASEFILQETGTRPSSVKKDKNRFQVKGVDENHRLAIMKLDRQPLIGGGQLVVRPLEVRMSFNDIDAFVCRWLKVDELAKTQDHNYRPENNRPRFQREVQAMDPEEEDAQQVAQVAGQASKPGPKATEVHPKKEESKPMDTTPGMSGRTSHGKGGAAEKGGGVSGMEGAWGYWAPPQMWWQPVPPYWSPEWSPPGKGSTTDGKGKGAVQYGGKGAGGKGDGKGEGKSKGTDGGKGKGKGGRGRPGEQGVGGGQ